MTSPTTLNPLDAGVDDLFHSSKSHVAAFFEKQVHLYRHDESLQDYFMMLQLDELAGPRVRSGKQRASDRVVPWAVRTADRACQLRPRRKINADVLFCPMPDFSRATENRLLVRTLLGLAQTDAKILCLLPSDAPCRQAIETQLAVAGRSGQVTFVDPLASLNAVEAGLRSQMARIRGRSAFEETVRILQPHGLGPASDIKASFQHIAYFVEAWERLAPWVEFDAVVTRCHWQKLCGAVCRTAQQRGKPVITFQQGVIGHSLDAPVTASTFVAFGESSAAFLPRVNRAFFQAVERPEPSVKYVNGGCLFDNISLLPDRFECQTLLMVDVPQPNGQGDFYGVQSQCQALLQLAEQLLSADPQLRLIIRPHPFWNNLDFGVCQRIVREHPNRCELSHPSWSVEDDLRRSSAVIGIFSGVLTVAAACGLPTIFIETDEGFTTGDLECFARQTLPPDAAFREIVKMLTDRRAYAQARGEALQSAREYYADGTNLDMTGAFFEGLLQAKL
jgi:hypothetical protein